MSATPAGACLSVTFSIKVQAAQQWDNDKVPTEDGEMAGRAGTQYTRPAYEYTSSHTNNKSTAYEYTPYGVGE